MSTIGDDKIAYTMLKNNGIYPGDPQVWGIYSYISTSSERVFKIIYGQNPELMIADLYSSPFCRNIILMWDRVNGLTNAGKEFITEYESRK